MKVLMKRTSAVTDGAVVELGASNIVQPRSTGAVLGVASACREVTVQDSPDDPIETLHVCQVAIHGDAQATLSGSASSAGGAIYATTDGKVTTTASGASIGLLCPKALSETTDYVDGDLVNVVLT